MRINRFAASAVLALAGVVPLGASATTVIQNGYVQAGVSDYGTLGSNSATPPGILFDKTGTGAYGINDFLTPGTPFEGFYLTGLLATGGPYSQYSNNTGSTSFGSWTINSLTGASATAFGTSTDGSLSILNTYNLTTLFGKSVIAIATTVTNNSTAGGLFGLRFLRTLDPDPDVNAFGSYDTQNAVLSNDQSCGTGTISGQTICLYSGSSYAHKAGVSQSWSTDPSNYLAGLNDGNGDNAIGIAFELGDLGAGQSLTLDYAYVLGASLDVVRDNPVPEPGSMLLVGASLAALGLFRRRQSAKK